MKKNLIILSVLFCLILALTGCPSPIPSPPLLVCDICGKEPCVCGNEVCGSCGKNPCVCELLSGDAQKDLLVGVGEDLINIFNPDDQKKAVDLANNLYYKYKNYDWDAISEELWEEYDNIYSSEFESFFSMPKRMIKLINGKQNATLEDLEILLTLSKFGRVVEFDDNTKSIKITKTNEASITAKFSDSQGTKCELKVWGEGKEIEGSYTYESGYWDYPEVWDEYWGEWVTDWDNGVYVTEGKRTVRVKIPTTIKMHLKQGSEALIAMTFKWDTNLKDYINTSMNLQVVNLEFEEETKVSTTEASAVFSFNYGEKNVIAAAANLPKYSLIAWEGGTDITEGEGEEWFEEYGEKYASLLGKVGKGEVSFDILGKVQVKGGFTDGAALVDANNNWNAKYKSNDYTGYWWEQPYYSLEAKNEQCDFFNKYTYLSVYYNKSIREQAKLLFQPYEVNGTSFEYNLENGEYEEMPYSCYYIEPAMYFPLEETSIAVMTFFNSSKFLGLIDLVEELANSYVELDSDHLIFGENFQIELDY